MPARAPFTVWIVGAGASKSHSGGLFPTLRELPGYAAELGVLSERARRHKFRALTSYLHRRHFGPIDSVKSQLNLESVLSILDLDIAIKPDGQLMSARESLIDILRATFAKLHKKDKRNGHEYNRLANLLGAEDCVITFNWDLLLDNALGREEVLRSVDVAEIIDGENHYARFVQNTSGWGDRTQKGIRIPRPIRRLTRRGQIIKAHGSIDWFTCTNEVCRSYGQIFPLLKYSRRPRCEGCIEPMEPVIVPPTLDKQVRELPGLRKIWSAATHAIGRADRVIIWGYSLPPTDFSSEWLLRQMGTKQSLHVVLINPDILDEDHGLNSSFIDRFLNPIVNPRSKVQVSLYRCFEEFDQGREVFDFFPSLQRPMTTSV